MHTSAITLTEKVRNLTIIWGRKDAATYVCSISTPRKMCLDHQCPPLMFPYKIITNGWDNKILDLLFCMFGFRMFGKELTTSWNKLTKIQTLQKVNKAFSHTKIYSRQKVEDFVIPPGVTHWNYFLGSNYNLSSVCVLESGWEPHWQGTSMVKSPYFFQPLWRRFSHDTCDVWHVWGWPWMTKSLICHY